MKPKILITIDVEVGDSAVDNENGFDEFVVGKIKGKEVGINFILNEIEKKRI